MLKRVDNMQISYQTLNGDIKHVNANIDPAVLECFLAQYVQPQLGCYKLIKLINCMDIPKLKANYIAYPSAPTLNQIERKKSISQFNNTIYTVDAHYPKLYKGCNSAARFIVQIANHMLNHYLDSKKYKAYWCENHHDHRTLFALEDIGLIVLQARYNFVSKDRVQIAFLTEDQIQALYANSGTYKDIRLVQYYADKSISNPMVEVDMIGGDYHSESDIQALSEFNKVLIIDRDFGKLPEQRVFHTTLENDQQGLVLVGDMEGKTISSIKKALPLIHKEKIKTLKELSAIDFARLQTGAQFIQSIS